MQVWDTYTHTVSERTPAATLERSEIERPDAAWAFLSTSTTVPQPFRPLRLKAETKRVQPLKRGSKSRLATGVAIQPYSLQFTKKQRSALAIHQRSVGSNRGAVVWEGIIIRRVPSGTRFPPALLPTKTVWAGRRAGGASFHTLLGDFSATAELFAKRPG